MSFTVRLSPDQISVEAGATSPLAVVVGNKGESSDSFEIQVEGIDGEWIAIPEPTFSAEASEERTERVFFKPARVPENTAGNYPFVVKVRSLNSGDSKTASGVLEIKSFNHLSLEITPKKGVVTPTRQHNDFLLTVMNLGNTEHSIQLFGNDPEDECTYEFDQDLVILGPGQSKQVRVVVKPRTAKLVAGTRLYGFSASARSTNQPAVAASVQAQLEQRPLLTPGILAFLVFAILLFGAWIALTPKPPVVSLIVSPLQVTQGGTIHISWDAREATRVEVLVNGTLINSDLQLKGETDYTTSAPAPLTVTAIPYKDAKAGAQKTQTVIVNAPVQVPDPVIETFDVRDRDVTLGESVLFTYKFNSAVTKAILAPTQQQLDLNTSELEIKPSVVGSTEYKILAYNAAGKLATSRTIRINVKEKVDVLISEFEVTPATVAPGEAVTVSWRVIKAAKVTLYVDGNAQSVPAEGSQMIPINAATTIKLVAQDDLNHSVSRVKTVKVSTPDPTPDPTISPLPGDTGGG